MGCQIRACGGMIQYCRRLLQCSRIHSTLFMHVFYAFLFGIVQFHSSILVFIHMIYYYLELYIIKTQIKSTVVGSLSAGGLDQRHII